MKNGWAKYEDKVTQGVADKVSYSRNSSVAFSIEAAKTARLEVRGQVELFVNKDARLIGVRMAKKSDVSYTVTPGGGKNSGMRINMKGLLSRNGIPLPKKGSVKLPLSWDEEEQMAIIDFSSVWQPEPRRKMRERVHKQVAEQIEEKIPPPLGGLLPTAWLDEIPELSQEGAGR